MRGIGVNPTIAAINPKDAGELDLTKSEAGGYQLATRGVGGASPIFGLSLVESAGVTEGKPLLLNPLLLGVLYLQSATLVLDPYSGLSTNTVRRLVEFNCLFHVRSGEAAWKVE